MVTQAIPAVDTFEVSAVEEAGQEPVKMITIRVPIRLIEAVKRAAWQERKSMNQWASSLIKQALQERSIDWNSLPLPERRRRRGRKSRVRAADNHPRRSVTP
jgi:predicted NACHT family NTPase